MKTTAQKNKKIIDFLYHFSDVIKRDNWIPGYNKDTDSLSFRKPKLSDSSRISYLGDEIALYLNKDKDVEGLFIEYFRTNFMKHHQELKGVAEDIDKQMEAEQDTVNLERMKSSDVLPELEEIVKSSLLENMQFQSRKDKFA